MVILNKFEGGCIKTIKTVLALSTLFLSLMPACTSQSKPVSAPPTISSEPPAPATKPNEAFVPAPTDAVASQGPEKSASPITPTVTVPETLLVTAPDHAPLATDIVQPAPAPVIIAVPEQAAIVVDEAKLKEQQASMDALIALAFPDLEKAPPRFDQVKLRIGMEADATQTKIEKIENAPVQNTVTNMAAILKDPYNSVERLKNTYILSSDATETFNTVRNALSQADAKTLEDGSVDSVMVAIWRSAAIYELIRISVAAESRSDRSLAAGALLGSLKYVEDERYRSLASAYYASGIFTECGNFLECYELIGHIGIGAEALTLQLAETEFLHIMSENFAKVVVNPFLKNLLIFRIQTLANHATLLENTGMYLASNHGKQPYMTEEQLASLRLTIDEMTGPDGFWQQTQETLRSQMPEVEGETSYEQMLDLLTTHLIAEFKKLKAYRSTPKTTEDILAGIEHGLIDQNMVKRADIFRPRLETGTADEQFWVKTLPERLLEGLMMTHYNNLAIKMYLLRVEHGAEMFLDLINTNLDDEALFTQKSFDPIAGFVALAFFAKFEFRLPTRNDWMRTLDRYASQMIKFAEPFETEKQRENPEYDFLDTTFIKSALVPIYAQFKLFDFIIQNFIENANLTAFSKGSMSLEDKEKWLAERMTGFNSIYYQWKQVAEAQDPFFETLNEMAASVNSVEKEELAELNGQQYVQYEQKLLTAACYGYWLPLDKNGNFIENSEGESVKKLVDQKPEWQSTYVPRQDEFGLSVLNEKSFDLSKVCGGTAKQVNLQVHKYLSEFHSRHMPQSYPQAILQVGLSRGGDIALTLATVSILSPAFGAVHNLSVKASSKFMRTQIMRSTVGMAGRVTGLLSKSLGRKFLRRQGLYWTQQGVNASISILMFTAVQRGLEHGMYKLNEKYDTDKFPGRKFMEYNPRLGLIENLKVNYAQELIFGGALFLVVPQFAAIAKRQIYTKSPLRFYRYKVNVANIDQYYMTRGLQKFEAGKGMVTGTKGMGMVEEAAYAAVPVAYNTVAFTSIPYVIRGYERSQGSDAAVWQGWKVFVEDDLANGFTYAGVFGAFHLGVSGPRYRNKTKFADTTQINAYYKALGLKPGSPMTPEVLKAAYEKAPKATAEEILVARQAYQTLSQQSLREAYDAAQFGREFGLWGWAQDLKLLSRMRGL